MKYFLLFATIVSPIFIRAQLVVSPSQPRFSDSILIRYSDKVGKFTRDSFLLARTEQALGDGDFKRRTLKLFRTEDNHFETKMVVHPEISALKVEIYTDEMEAPDNQEIVRFYLPGKSVTVPGAMMAFNFSDDIHQLFKEETRLHPQNMLPYAKYFNILPFLKPDSAKIMIGKYISLLETYRGNRPADLLTALCIGYAKTDKLDNSRLCLLELMKRFPETNYPAFAFIYYNYEYYKKYPVIGGDSSIIRYCTDLFIKYPNAPISKDYNVIYNLKHDTGISISNFRQVINNVLAEEPNNIHYESLLVDIYLERKQLLEEGRARVLKLLDRYYEGKVHDYYRTPVVRMETGLGNLYRQQAAISYHLQSFGESAMYASAAIQSFAGTNESGNHLPELLQLRAKSYREMGNLMLAMQDYRQLYFEGDEAAGDSIRRLYPYCNSNATDVENVLKEVRKNRSTNGEMAPDFEAHNLQGDTVVLKNLHGNIIVLNFWGLGCGPCIAEMPELNKLVGKYRHRNDVKFMAPAGDQSKALISFLQKKQFSYEVLNNAGDIWKDYRIDALPIHIVIDRKGKIIKRIKGTQPNIVDLLSMAIDRSIMD